MKNPCKLKVFFSLICKKNLLFTFLRKTGYSLTVPLGQFRQIVPGNILRKKSLMYFLKPYSFMLFK